MRILITGAAGTLGRAVTPRLEAAGHGVLGLDVERPAGAAWTVGDIRDADVVDGAMAGIDLVVHAAAWHGIHLANHPPSDFFELNVRGTFNVWEAARRRGVRGVVFCSTMGVYGRSRVPQTDRSVARVREDLPLLPTDVYGWTKQAGEELFRFDSGSGKLPTVALRLGMFVPEPPFRYGIRLLYGGVHEEDVAEAALLALDALGDGRIRDHVALNVEAPLPFAEDDAADLRQDPLRAIERHFPGSTELLRERGVRSLKPITEIFEVDRLERVLGFRPRHDFGEWLDLVRRDPSLRADADPPWP